MPRWSSDTRRFVVAMGSQEVQRLRAEHPFDDDIISNDRVKGRLKVTRAFGAGFLKQVLYQLGMHGVEC